MKKTLPILTAICLLLLVPTFLSAQRFYLKETNPVVQNYIHQGDSAFFKKDYSSTIQYYQLGLKTQYQEEIALNQIQNQLANQDTISALSTLKTLTDHGFYKTWILERDSVYQGLIPLSGFLEQFHQIEGNFNKYIEAHHILYPFLVKNIYWMTYMDQYYDQVIQFKKDYPGYMDETSLADLENLKKETLMDNVRLLQNMVQTQGYLWKEQIGQEASEDFFKLAMKADFNLNFQEQYLVELNFAVKNKLAPAEDLAYLTDQVRKNFKKKQVYGTLFNYSMIHDPQKGDCMGWEMYPVEEPKKLNERRKALGLDVIENYQKQLEINSQPQ